MSAQPRCHECGHRRGYRSTAPMTRDKGTEPRPKKAPCLCACHPMLADGLVSPPPVESEPEADSPAPLSIVAE